MAKNDDMPDSKIFPYDYHPKDLPNGLRVIVVPTDFPNIVSLQIPVSVGSRNEVEPGKSGFAHFFEHMMFRGTEKFPNEEYTEILKNAGADQNAFTSDDLTNYHITFSKEDLETVLMLEADRFQNLKYSVEDFKTEARAVLGEYNKNFANPVRKLLEAQRNAAFQKHTYKHTTMGFIEDIENMPKQYDYSLKFFDRYYRPEKTSIILVGDVEPQRAFQLVEKYWGDWQPGNFEPDIPEEPKPNGPVYEHVEWEAPTLPWMTVAFRGPAFSETENDMATMDIISRLAFSQSSPLYQKLVVKEQVVDQLWSYFPDRIDPYLVTVAARVKEVKDVWYVRDEILKTFGKLRTETVSAQRLEDIKANLKYSFANGLDNSVAIAEALVGYVARTRDPETINRLYRLYETVTPQDVKEKANTYFTDQRLVVTSLASEPLPEVASKTNSIDTMVKADLQAPPDIETVLIRNDSPIVNFRILFNVGAALDPQGQEGLAQLTAAMVTEAGSQSMSYEEIQEALFPMAASFNNQMDKEMTVFFGRTHVDNLNAYYDIISGQLLNPGWDEEDFKRVKSNLVNFIKVSLRENNDEELGKEALYEMIYGDDHPYGHLNYGHIETVDSLTLDDVKNFYRKHYTRANLVLGLAGDFPDAFLHTVKRDLGSLPEGAPSQIALPQPPSFDGLHAEIIQKETRATAVSFGFPIEVNRAHPDFPALWLVRSYFGEHRSSTSYLYQRIREIRGMNYGDYAYIEYFPRGMFQFHPDANLGRQQQIFQVWIRPVPDINQAHFATRVAMYELNKLIENGLSEEDFEATRNYLLKFVNILTQSQGRQLGYALDSRYYGISDFNQYITQALKDLTLEEVNRVIREHLQDEDVKFVFITKDADGLRERLINDTASTMTYGVDMPGEILEEDKIIEKYPLNFKAENVVIRPVEEVFLD